MTSDELADTARTAAVAALAYFGGEGEVRIRPITPLLLEGEAAFTLAFSESELAGDLRNSPEACLVFSDSRLARVGWKPLAAGVRLEATTDVEGEIFREELLTDELVKYPPDRRLLDSMMLRRENWWYMPRFIFRAVEVGEVRPAGKRTEPGHATLAWNENGGISADTVEASEWEEARIHMRSRSGRELPESGAAALHRHDFTVPDMEQRSSLLAVGKMFGGRLSVESREGERGLGSPPGLIKRWRDFRDFRKRCVAAIERYEKS